MGLFIIPDENKSQEIIELVDKAHLEDVIKVIGTDNYNFLLRLDILEEEKQRLMYLVDMLLNSEVPKEELEFNSIGMRVEKESRALDLVISMHYVEYLYSLIDRVTSEHSFIRPVVEEMYTSVTSDMTQEELEDHFNREYRYRLEKDVAYYDSLPEGSPERKEIILYFRSLEESESIMSSYMVGASLRDSGATFKGLYTGTWEKEVED